MTWDWQFEAGAFVRKEILFQLQSMAAQRGLHFQVLANDGGWISTTYLIRVTGSKSAVENYRNMCQQWSISAANDE